MREDRQHEFKKTGSIGLLELKISIDVITNDQLKHY